MKRTRGTCRVRLYAAGCRYQNQYSGVGLKHKLTELAKARQLSFTTFDASALTLADVEPTRLTTTPAVECVDLPDGIGGVQSATYLDASQDIGLGYWTTTGGEWEADEDPDFAGTILYQRDATENQFVSAKSKFDLPVLPHIVIDLWRGEPSPDQDRADYQPYTSIRFGRGAEQFSLFIPYSDAPYVAIYNLATNRWERLAARGNAKLPSVQGMGEGERHTIEIACHRGYICVRFGRDRGEAGSWVAYEIPTHYWGVQTYSYQVYDEVNVYGRLVDEGPIAIDHTGGQLMFRWWPIYHHPTTTHVSWTGRCDVGYSLFHEGYSSYYGDAVPEAARMSGVSWHQSVWEAHIWGDTRYYETAAACEPTVTPMDPEHEISTGYSTSFTWRCSWVPAAFTLSVDGQADITHYASPVVYGVQCTAQPYVMDRTEWPSYTDVSAQVQGISVSSSEGLGVTMAGLKLKNRGGAFRTVRPYQMVTVELGYEWDDDSTDLDNNPLVFVGYVVSPGMGARVGLLEDCDVVLYCPLTRLKDEKAFGIEPDFQLHTAKAAVQWLAERAGMHTDQMSLAGSDTAMCYGSIGYDTEETAAEPAPENDALLPAFGSELVRSVEEYAQRDGESIVYLRTDTTGYGTDNAVMWKLVKTNGALASTDGTLYELAEDYDDANYATEYHLYSVEADCVGMDPGEYADVVVVRGQALNGARVQAVWGDTSRLTDPADADWAGGWRHVYCEARDHVKTVGLAASRAEEIFGERVRRPDMVTVETDLLPSITKIDRFTITNATSAGAAYDAGVLSKTYRVVSYQHVWHDRETMPRTILTGRSLETS